MTHSTPEQTISARWVAPVVSPPIADGVVSLSDGRITYVGPTDGRKIDQRFDDAILLPGLVNAHTHLDLTGAKGLTPPQPDFCAWLKSVIDFRKTRTPEQVRADVTEGVRQCLAAGTTLIGDIALAAYDYRPLNAVAFQELIGLSEERCIAAINSWRAAGFIPAGVSPHGPYSFRFSRLNDLPSNLPLAMHVAESSEEMELLTTENGPMRRFLEEIGAWDATGLPPSLGDLLSQLAIRDGNLLVIHGNYLNHETGWPHNADLVYCPRTHHAFGHPAYPLQEVFDHGLFVHLATDSLASNPDLSVLNEARFVFRHVEHPQFKYLQKFTHWTEAILKMITYWSAFLLEGNESRRGMLRENCHADLTVVGLPPTKGDPVQLLLDSDESVRAVFIAGNRMV